MQALPIPSTPLALLVFLGLPFLHSMAWAQLPAATVMSVTGGVKVLDKQGQERALEKGAVVNSSDKVITSDGALVQLRLNDGGYMSIRPNTEMVIDRFNFDEKNAANSSFLVSLIKGGFRSITGLIGRSNPDAYQIRTSTATIGIRGTDHEPMFIPSGLPNLPNQADPGFYDKVNDGETFIRNNTGVLALKRGQIGFAPVVPDRPPLTLQKVPDFYKIEVKMDARDPKDAAGDNARKPAGAAMLLRPSLTARKEVLQTKDTLTDGATATTIAPLVTKTTATLPTSTVLEPVATTITPSTTLVAPSTTTLSTSPTLTTTPTTSIAPTTTLIAPTTTLIAPTTTITPTTTIAPTTTLIAPTSTLIAPTTTITPTTTISPTTTLKSTTLLK